MANLNKVMLIGNLTRDPEIRYTPKGTAVSDLGLAINRQWTNDQGQKQEETTYVDITFWGRQAELAQQYLTKGRGVYIEGRLQMDTWDDKETGKKRSKLKIQGETLQFLPDGRGGNPSPGGGAPPRSQGAPPRHAGPQGGSASNGDDFHEEDDIPF